MKIATILLVFIATFLFPISCSDDLLDQVNPNTISTGTFWRNAADVKVAVNGMYHPITSVFFWGRVMHSGPLTRTDELNVRPGGTNTLIANFIAEPGARHTTRPWQQAYQCIYRANSVLENITSENVPDATERNGFLGQAYFMRAFSYWYLVNIYGNVPTGQEGGIVMVLKTPDPTNNDELFPSQVTAQVVWDQIVADLEQAESTLPDAWPAEDLGRPTKWSATGLKGKAYLYRSAFLGVNEYAQAEASFKDIVNSGRYELLPGERFRENFTQENENNVESLFELQFHPIGKGNFVWGADVPLSGTQSHFIIEYAPPTISPDPASVVNPWVKALFEENGETFRRDASLVYDYPGAESFAGQPFPNGLEEAVELVNGLENNEGIEPIFTKKYGGLELPSASAPGFLGEDYGPNWRIIRYSDILLMLAEVLNEQGKTSEAEGYLNQVRERAAVTPKTGLSQEEMRQAIIDERVLELFLEGDRFFDLLRWGLADDYLGESSLHVTEGGFPHPRSLAGPASRFRPGKHELVPLPLEEIGANSNLKQNPGY